jgi:hypothetical protein
LSPDITLQFQSAVGGEMVSEGAFSECEPTAIFCSSSRKFIIGEEKIKHGRVSKDGHDRGRLRKLSGKD